MNWNLLASTLLGALITYSAILLTQAIELWKRDRASKKLLHALLQALRAMPLGFRSIFFQVFAGVRTTSIERQVG